MSAMPVLIVFCIAFTSFPYAAFSISGDSETRAIQTVSNIKNEECNYKQIQKINNRLKNQEEQIKGLILNLNRQLKNHAIQIEKQKSQFQNYISRQKTKNYIALFIILFGLLLEILGALLLGSPSFSSKIKKLVNFKMNFTPGKDLFLKDSGKDQILTNYSMLGNIFLWFGFSVQFIGTTCLLDINLLWQIVIVFIGVFFGFCILFWLLGIDSFDQTRYQKCKTLFGNIIQLLKIIFTFLLQLKKQCDICLKRVKKDKVFILWYDEKKF